MAAQILYNAFLFTTGFMILAPWPALTPHLCGLLGLFGGFAIWSIISVFVFILHIPYTLAIMLPACLAVSVIGFWIRRDSFNEKAFWLRRILWFTVYLVALVGVTLVASQTNYLFFTPDSYSYIAGAGALIEQSKSLAPGDYSPGLVATISSAGPIALAALWAGSRMFGVEFWYSVIPVAATGFLPTFALLTLKDLEGTVPRRSLRATLALLAALLLLSVPSFLYNSHYLHSNLLTGFFFTFAVVGVSVHRRSRESLWLLIAAVAMSCCILLRTEMVQYAAIPIVLVLGTDRISPRRYLLFLAPILLVASLSQLLKGMAGHSTHDPSVLQWGFLGIYAASYTVIHLQWTRKRLAPLAPRATASLLVIIVLYSLYFNHQGMVRSLSGLLHVVSYREGLLEGGAWGGTWLLIGACATLNAAFIRNRVFRLYGFALVVYFAVRAMIYSLPFFPNVEINQYNSGARILFHILPAAIVGAMHILGSALTPRTDSTCGAEPPRLP